MSKLSEMVKVLDDTHAASLIADHATPERAAQLGVSVEVLQQMMIMATVDLVEAHVDAKLAAEAKAKPYACRKCSERFAVSDKRREHEKSHVP